MIGAFEDLGDRAISLAVGARRVLSALFNQRGVIEPVSNARGRGVRYRLTD
jgi:hypothetical protein